MTQVNLEQIEADGGDLVRQGREIQVADAEGYQRAGLLIRGCSQFIRQVEDFMGPILKAADQALKTARQQRDRLVEPAQAVKKDLGAQMERWDRAERDRVAQEQAERTRLAQEEAQLAALSHAEASGDEGAVAQIAQTSPAEAVAFVPPPPPPPPKAPGVSFTTHYKAEVVDLLALVRAIAQGQAPLTYVQANQVALNQSARALKEEFKVPGVRVIAERGAAVRV